MKKWHPTAHCIQDLVRHRRKIAESVWLRIWPDRSQSQVFWRMSQEHLSKSGENAVEFTSKVEHSESKNKVIYLWICVAYDLPKTTLILILLTSPSSRWFWHHLHNKIVRILTERTVNVLSFPSVLCRIPPQISRRSAFLHTRPLSIAIMQITKNKVYNDDPFKRIKCSVHKGGGDGGVYPGASAPLWSSEGGARG